MSSYYTSGLWFVVKVVMDEKLREEIKTAIISEIKKIKDEIESFKQNSKPVEPDNAIGRLTRMDAIQTKNLNKALLNTAKIRLDKLENALGRIDDDDFGDCRVCEEPIAEGRLRLMPESVTCIDCTKG